MGPEEGHDGSAVQDLAMTEAEGTPVLWATTPLAKHELRARPPAGAPPAVLLAGALGETASAQAVYTPGQRVTAATVAVSDLTPVDGGTAIAAALVAASWVRYLPIQHNSPDIPADELAILAPNCFPDPLWDRDTIPVDHGFRAIINNGLYVAAYSNPIWIDVRIPRDARPGEYRGSLTVTGDGTTTALPIVLQVRRFALPERQHLAVINWLNLPLCPSTATPYSPEYWQELRRDLRFLADHGQTDIVHPGFSLVARRDDQSWDTGRFEEWTEAALEAGMRQFHLHGLGTGRTLTHLACTSEVKPLNPANLAKLSIIDAVARRRGWSFVANVCDEPFIMNEITYMERVRQVKQAAPGIRLVEALEAEYLGDLDIYCPKLNHLHMWQPRFQELQQAGRELWYYICLHPTGRYPNRFIDQSMLKHRVLFWIHYLYGLDGYLHWGGNHYGSGQDPYSEAGVQAGVLPLGDAVLWYPGQNGPVASLRQKAQRDGLQDYAYLAALEARVRALKERVGDQEAFWVRPRQRPLELCRQVIRDCQDYTRDPQALLDTRQQLAAEIECLDDEFYLYVQTSPADRALFPHGPRNLGIRGLVPPGARVTVNGIPVENVRPSGYFLLYHFLLDGEPEVVVRATWRGRERTAVRRFTLAD